MESNDIFTLSSVAIAIAVLLMNSCNMFTHLIENRSKQGYRTSIWIHMITTFLLVLAVLFLFLPLIFGWPSTQFAIKLSAICAFGSVITMIPCSCFLILNLIIREDKQKDNLMCRWNDTVG